MSRAEIANKVGLSPHTVDSYLKLIYQRTRVRDRRSLSRSLCCATIERAGASLTEPAAVVPTSEATASAASAT